MGGEHLAGVEGGDRDIPLADDGEDPPALMGSAEIDEVLGVNLLSAFYAMRAFLRNAPRGRPQ